MHLTEFATCAVLIPRCLWYVNATLFLLLTDPSPPALIANDFRGSELSAIFQRLSVKWHKKQNQFISSTFSIAAFRCTNGLVVFTILKCTYRYSILYS